MYSSNRHVAALYVSIVMLITVLLQPVHGSSVAASTLRARDASTNMSGGNNNEGEAHTPIVAPSGSRFTSIDVQNGQQIPAYWTANPQNTTATQTFIMIHGRQRDGDVYWTTMNNVLKNAVSSKVDGADSNAIVVAPQFFSARYNSGQYGSTDLAWGDVNAWQAGDPAVLPAGTKLTSFDALDALVDHFLDTSKYPAMQRVVVVGHGGGGQLSQRYATVAKTPTNTTVNIRYIHGDPSSCAYFTDDRPSVSGETLPSKASCSLYNTWRYGFDNFTGTIDGLKTPQEYFKQYTSRDVISIVGYQDVDASGDTYCMAQMQGGTKRRDRNLVWWQYINTLARTGEDLNGFPGTFTSLPDWSGVTNRIFGVRLIVVEDADHNAEKVFESDEGRAALFAGVNTVLPTGWRPSGWKNTTNALAPPPIADATSSKSSSSSKSSAASSSSSSSSSQRTSSAASLRTQSTPSLWFSTVVAVSLVLFCHHLTV